MKTEKKSGKDEVCSVLHCNNPAVTDGYCETHLERLELIKESYEHAKQIHLRTREDEKQAALDPGSESTHSFREPENYLE
ncbi:MAG: hypothetical protein ACE5IM_03365 [Nitrospinota bacterium]